MKKLILLVIMLGFACNVNPNSNNSLTVASFQEFPNLEKIMEILKRVESKNNPKAVSPRGKYVGVLQISKSCIKEVNTHYGTRYTHKDALSVGKSEEIFMHIMERGIKLFTAKHKQLPTEEQLVRMWNGGLYNGYKKPNTKKYYAKYLRQKVKYEKKTLTL